VAPAVVGLSPFREQGPENSLFSVFSLDRSRNFWMIQMAASHSFCLLCLEICLECVLRWSDSSFDRGDGVGSSVCRGLKRELVVMAVANRGLALK